MKYWIVLLSLLGLTACVETEDRLSKSWGTTFVDPESRTGVPNDSAQGLFYWRFYTNGELACFTSSGEYRLINWELSPDEQTIFIYRQSMQLPTLQLQLNTLFDNEWSAKLPNEKEIVIFNLQRKFQHWLLDLMAPERNRWRYKPAHKLSPDALKQKVVDHLRYASDYFEIVQKREQTYFEPKYLNLPVWFYRGGLVLEPFTQTSQHWRNCFYDEAEALQAWHYYRQAFKASGLMAKRNDTDIIITFQKSFEQMATGLENN
ncbi:MAG: hypothetical protein QM669_08645 [Siphonobacter sp.]